MPSIITASTLPTIGECMCRAAAKAFGARGKMKSDFRDRLEAEHPYLIAPKKNGIYAVIGTSCHAGCEMSLKTDLETGSHPARQDVIDCATDHIKTIEDIGYETDIPRLGEAVGVVARLAGFWADKVAPNLGHPKLVEVRLDAKIGDVILSGQLDLLTVDGDVSDHKFSKRATNCMAQLGGQFMLAKSHGHEVSSISSSLVNRASSKKEPEWSTQTFYMQDAGRLAYRYIQRASTAIGIYMQNGDPEAFDANPGSQLCSPKYCPAHGTRFCRYGK
jgi:hypothetical protein